MRFFAGPGVGGDGRNGYNCRMKETEMRVLFVCLGNICRSPAADGVFRGMAQAAGVDVEVDSAGIGSWHVGQLPDRRMRECGRRHGYTFDHRARQVTPGDFGNFDLVVGMDVQNIADLRDLAPDEAGEAKIRLMADYLTRHPGRRSIPDPYYGEEEDFEMAVELIEDAAREMVRRIAKGERL